jgi:hypothetical protein
MLFGNGREFMEAVAVTERDRAMARVCESCPVCSYARATQKGLLFGFVKKIEDRVCPFCMAYERVHGRKAHEPAPGETS